MKKFLKIIVIILVLLLSGTWYVLTSPVLPGGGDAPAVPVRLERITADVAYLTSTPYPRNAQYMSSLLLAAEYIEAEFRKTTDRVSRQEYDMDQQLYRNVIAEFGPADGELLVIGAHYDVCYNQPGADDNASGVAGILELARLFQQLQPTLKYRIQLIGYTLEEPPYFRTQFMGSYIHALSLSEGKVPVKGMICLECIGYFSEEKGSQEYPAGILETIYPTTGNFIAVVGRLGEGKLLRPIKKGMKAGGNIPVESIKAPPSLPGIDFSDHLNYWAFGYDAVMVTNTAFYRNKNYHEPTDTKETLDYEKMAEVIKGVYWAVVNLE